MFRRWFTWRKLVAEGKQQGLREPTMRINRNRFYFELSLQPTWRWLVAGGRTSTGARTVLARLGRVFVQVAAAKAEREERSTNIGSP